MSNPIVIIGAGLAGLTCARQLHSNGIEFILLEGSDKIGGRVRTDNVDGFLLDRGFQVFLTAYPEAAKFLNYETLELRTFEPGSLIRTDIGLVRMSDPWRRPQHALQTAFAPIGSFADKLRVGRLRWSSSRGSLQSLFERQDHTTEAELKRYGFTKEMIEKFLRPFLGGVFLDRDLETSSRMMSFVFRMFSEGDAALPAMGMGAIPHQLALGLPTDSIRVNSPVEAISASRVTLESGEIIEAGRLVVATEQPSTAKLLPELAIDAKPRSVCCVYFSAPEPPVTDRMLVLNGTGRGPVNNFCVPSEIAPSYAPDGQSLISATVLSSTVDRSQVVDRVKQQMRGWFGKSVDFWTHLRTYHIPYALPNQSAPAFDPPVRPLKIRDNVFVCGDHRTNGSINGAMQSGRLVADEILHTV